DDAAGQLELFAAVTQRIFLVPATDRRVGDRIASLVSGCPVEFSMHVLPSPGSDAKCRAGPARHCPERRRLQRLRKNDSSTAAPFRRTTSRCWTKQKPLS